MSMEQHKDPQKEANNQQPVKSGAPQDHDKNHVPGQSTPDQSKK